jgi:hypothetical protein
VKACPYAYRIVGAVREPRRLVDATAAFAGYLTCNPHAQVEREAFLSAFCYGEDFHARANNWGVVDTRSFNGVCWSPWIWSDIDRDGNLEAALRDARRLAAVFNERFECGGDNLLIFFSGSKGFHLGLPTALWLPEPSVTFHRVTRRFAENTAEAVGVTIDAGIYDKVRAFRAPNSRHPKTGLYKRRLTADELNTCTLEQILLLAKEPSPFDLPGPPGHSEQAATDWLTAAQHVERQAEAHVQRRAATNDSPKLNRLTLDFIRDGAEVGDRHRLLYSAAANLGEFGCPEALAHALLTEAALDSGLPPSEVRRQIDCGLDSTNNGGSLND